MAREEREGPTEMPERLFRKSRGYAEIQEIGRQARQERADLDALEAAAHLGRAVDSAPGALLAVGLLVAGPPRRLLMVVALVGWAVVIVVGLRWSGVI